MPARKQAGIESISASSCSDYDRLSKNRLLSRALSPQLEKKSAAICFSTWRTSVFYATSRGSGRISVSCATTRGSGRISVSCATTRGSGRSPGCCPNLHTCPILSHYLDLLPPKTASASRLCHNNLSGIAVWAVVHPRARRPATSRPYLAVMTACPSIIVSFLIRHNTGDAVPVPIIFQRQAPPCMQISCQPTSHGTGSCPPIPDTVS